MALMQKPTGPSPEDITESAMLVSLEESGNLEQKNIGYSGVAAFVEGQFRRSKVDRMNDEERWMMAYRNHRGLYGSSKRRGSSSGGCSRVCNCIGYAGVGGPCYAGVAGACYAGVGDKMYGGVGSPAYNGVGGSCNSGVGGPAYDGVGGPCYRGVGGACYTGVCGGANCPSICSRCGK